MHVARLRGSPPIRQTAQVGIVATVAFCALLLVALVALVPLRRPPFAGPSFMVGFAAGELAGQLLVVTLALVAVLAARGWPPGTLGAVALVAAGAASACDATLLARALEARAVVRRALLGATGVTVAARQPEPSWLRWWRTSLAVPLHGPRVAVHRDLAYDDDGDPQHTLDVLLPAGGANGAPVMLFVHGGAWTIGTKRQQCLPMLFELAARGWVCVSCDYRLSPRATWPDHIVDVKRALAWTKAHVGEFGGAVDRLLVVSGNSAGGQLAALAALTPNDPAFQPGFENVDTSVDACVSLYGVLEMTGDPTIAGTQGRALAALLRRSVMKAGLADARDLYEAASPMHRITASSPPFLVLHGTKDTLVSVGVARAFVGALKAASSAPVCYMELPWAQHGFDMLCSPRTSATTLGVVQFLDALLERPSRRGSTERSHAAGAPLHAPGTSPGSLD